MSVNDSYAKITRAAKELLARWEELEGVWRDEKRLAFNKKYMDPLQAELRKTGQAMERIDAMLYQLRDDCR